MATEKQQYCDHCGEPMGVFAHSRRYDGPLSCGQRECDRSARDSEAAELDDARERAETDGYSMYGGPGGRW